MINGMLNSMIKMESAIFVSICVSSEIPITPPSIKPLGSKKPLSPKPAEAMPSAMRRISLRLYRMRFLNRFAFRNRLILSMVLDLSGLKAVSMVSIILN